MPGYVITAVFEVDAARVLSGGVLSGGDLSGGDHGRDVLAGEWGAGHRLSHLDAQGLTLVVELQAPDRAAAGEAVLARTGRWWAGLTGAPLPPPATFRLDDVLPRAMVVPGAVGAGPDRELADAAAGVAARLRAIRAALAELTGSLDLTELEGSEPVAQTRSTMSAMESAIREGRNG